MQAEQEKFTLKCLSMGQHHATLEYCGPISREGALALAGRLEPLFGYYQYSKVILRLESPGGEVEGLDYLLRVLSQYAKQGKRVETQSTFMCASAAAVLLSAGHFGTRRVCSQTHLLFHSSRLQGANIEWTAASSTMLTNALLSVDRKITEALLERLIAACGGKAGFVEVITARFSFVASNWSQLAPQLITLTSRDGDLSAPAWLKSLKRIMKLQSSPSQMIDAFKRNLVERFQTDTPMHALEAFVLCLIDEVQGVIHADQVRVDAAAEHQGFAEPRTVVHPVEVLREHRTGLATNP
jgi:hypothetical protein